MGLKSFEHYFNTHKRNIQIICTSLNSTTNHRITYRDLYQEAVLKLLQNYKQGKPLDINYTKTCIKNHLVDYIRKNTKDSLVGLDIDNLLYALKKQY